MRYAPLSTRALTQMAAIASRRCKPRLIASRSPWWIYRSLKKAEQDAWTLAEEVLQAVTLDEAKRKASIYLGLADPF
jgi:hypothetical protein